MEQITLRLPLRTLAEVDREAEEAGTSRSEYLRDVVESRNEHGEEAERLREEVDELRTEVERLRREKRQILSEREEKKELARYVEEERRLERERRSANVVERARWFLFGRDG